MALARQCSAGPEEATGRPKRFPALLSVMVWRWRYSFGFAPPPPPPQSS